MFRKYFTLFIILFSLCLQAFAHDDEELFHPKVIKDGMQLSILDCVASAFKNSPKIKHRKYELDIAKSNLGIAKAQYFPVIDAGTGFYHENNSDNEYYSRRYRELPNVGITINKMVWDFGKTTAYIKMEEFYKLGAEYEFIDSLCSTLFDVKIKYYNLLKANAKLQIAQKDIEINKRFVKNAKLDADFTTAKLNLSYANIALTKAENDYINAKVDLSNSMYLDSLPNFTIQNTKTFNFNNDYLNTNSEPKAYPKYTFPFSRENAIQLAYDSSPDLMVLKATKNAMEQSLKFVKKTYLPELSTNVGYGYNNTNQTSNSSLQIGVSLNSNINLMELKHSIKGADAQLNIAENEIIHFKKDLFYEVKRAFNNFDKTELQLPIAQLAAKQATENLKLVETKYNTGVLNYIALQDARKDYINTINNYVDTIYQYNIALIELEMAMHYHIVDIHHKTEHAMNYHSEALINHLNEVLGCDEYHNSKNSKKRKKENL